MPGATITEAPGLTPGRAMLAQLSAEPLERRYRVPGLRDGIVWRTDVLTRIECARGYPLVVLTAPAGYGKTTVLAQWSEGAQRPLAWVTLDTADDRPADLAHSISSALEWVGIDRGCPGQDFALVLDDAHAVPPSVLADAVLELLSWFPPQAQLVLSSRCVPALPLGRMRGQRMVFEIGAGDLAMSSVEAAALLRRSGIESEFTAVQDLVRRTEGWPAALALAANSLMARRDSAEAMAEIAGDDHRISEYFRAEFLATLSPASVHFLTRTSLLDRLSGPLCDAVLDRTRSATSLARLARANVPMFPVDSTHEWYRVHGLFREMLQTELRRTEPHLEPELHRRAGDWHSRSGDLDQAIGHARSAGDLARTGELLWANLPEYLGQGRNDTVQRWLSGVTPEQASGCPSLALAAAHSHLALGRITLAEQWARSASVGLSRRGAAGAQAQRAGVLMIQSWAARSGARRMGEDAARAYELLADDSPWRTGCCLLRGTSALLTGDHAQAGLALEEGAARGGIVSPGAASLCLAQLAVLALERGDGELAGDLTARARELIGGRDLITCPAMALVFAVAAAVDVGQGRVDEAKVSSAQCSGLLAMLTDFAPWYGAEAQILLARGSLALGDVTGARERLADASRLARRTVDVVIFQQWFDQAWDEFDQRAETALIGVGSLTTAELRVLRFLPTHFSFHEIAERLHVSSNTVKTHVHAVYRKLDASSRSQAVANATQAGLLGY